MTDTTELRRLLAEATPGSWEAYAALVAVFRNEAAALLDELEQLRLIRDAARDVLGDYDDMGLGFPHAIAVLRAALATPDPKPGATT